MQKRRFKDYFFSYSWQEMGSVRTLRDAWVGGYISLGLIAYLLNPLGDPKISAVLVGTIFNYPAYLLGLFFQHKDNPAALEEHELMVWQIGNLSKIATLVGFISIVKVVTS